MSEGRSRVHQLERDVLQEEAQRGLDSVARTQLEREVGRLQSQLDLASEARALADEMASQQEVR